MNISIFQLSQSLNALGYSALPELKMDLSPTVPSFLTVVPSHTTTSNTQLLSTEMLLQQLALQAASLQGAQSTVSPTPCVASPTVSTPNGAPTVIDNSHVDTVPAVQYLNLVHHQVQPTIYIQHPMLFSLQQNTVPSVSLGNTVLPALSQMDIHNIVSNLMLNTRG